MRDPDEVIAIAKLKAARVRYIEAVVRRRAARDEAEANLRRAEHEIAEALGQLFRDRAPVQTPVVSEAGTAQIRAPQF